MKKDTLLTDVVERIAKRDTCLYITNKHDVPLPDFADRKVDSRKFMVHLETFADDNQPRLTDQSPRNVMLPMLNEQCTSTFVVSLRESACDPPCQSPRVLNLVRLAGAQVAKHGGCDPRADCGTEWWTVAQRRCDPHKWCSPLIADTTTPETHRGTPAPSESPRRAVNPAVGGRVYRPGLPRRAHTATPETQRGGRFPMRAPSGG
jgi:hypothetical protein